ncbi:MAG: hypothetical protein ACRC14_04735 [Paracoccaceae bacterium]
MTAEALGMAFAAFCKATPLDDDGDLIIPADAMGYPHDLVFEALKLPIAAPMTPAEVEAFKAQLFEPDARLTGLPMVETTSGGYRYAATAYLGGPCDDGTARDDDQTPSVRASRLLDILTPHYASVDVGDLITDVLADLRHACDLAKLAFADQDKKGQAHYLAEVFDGKPT